MAKQATSSKGARSRRAADNRNAHVAEQGGTTNSLDQVREILFGAEITRTETELRTLEKHVDMRFQQLEKALERRFEKQAGALEQKFNKLLTMLEAESSARQESISTQQAKQAAELKSVNQALLKSKTGRAELADLLADLSKRLKNAAG
jgi:hypothetical protein